MNVSLDVTPCLVTPNNNIRTLNLHSSILGVSELHLVGRYCSVLLKMKTISEQGSIAINIVILTTSETRSKVLS